MKEICSIMKRLPAFALTAMSDEAIESVTRFNDDHIICIHYQCGAELHRMSMTSVTTYDGGKQSPAYEVVWVMVLHGEVKGIYKFQ